MKLTILVKNVIQTKISVFFLHETYTTSRQTGTQ
jgi:hypothetical protein